MPWPCPGDALVRTLLDKTGFQTGAEALGFAVPKSRFLAAAMTAMLSLDQLRFPCVLKPTTKDEAYARSFAKAYRVESRDEAAALWQHMQAVIDSAIIQEWIDGGDSDVYFCLQYRPPSGAPAVIVLRPQDPAMAAAGGRHRHLHSRARSRGATDGGNPRLFREDRLCRPVQHGVQARPARTEYST